MSLTLGPIHHWIFEQILLVEARGETLAAGLADALGEKANERWRAILAEHPGRYTGNDLAELASENIHGSLDGMIRVVQAREAKLVAWALAEKLDGGMALLEKLFTVDGRRIGESIREHIERPSAPDIFAALRELWLEGMPCDVRVGLLSQNERSVAWAREGFPLAQYWEGTGAAADTMLALHCAWQTGFVAAIDERFAVSATNVPESGAGRFEFKLMDSEGN